MEKGALLNNAHPTFAADIFIYNVHLFRYFGIFQLPKYTAA